VFLTNVISGDGHFGTVNFNIGAFNILDDVMAMANTQRFVRFVDSRVNLLQYGWLLLHPPVITDTDKAHLGLLTLLTARRPGSIAYLDLVVNAVLSETQLHPFPILFPLLIRCMVVGRHVYPEKWLRDVLLCFSTRSSPSKDPQPFFNLCTEN